LKETKNKTIPNTNAFVRPNMPIRINKTSPKLNRVVISSSDMRKELDRAISVEANNANKGNKEEITHILESVASVSFLI